MFEKAKNLYKIQKQAKEIKRELQSLHIEAEMEGVKVVINGEQEMIEVVITDQAPTDKIKLGALIAKCFNKAIKKSQQIAAEKMRSVMGDMGLEGLMGKAS